jgi:oligopeptide transport system ATP-binding protein
MEAVVVRYGRLTAVDRLSLAVGEGETLGLVGESGCGKTSLAKALVGLKPISQGRILLAGTDTSAGEATKRGWLPQRIQLLFQDPAASLSPRLTVRRLLQEPLRIRGTLAPPAWEEVRRLMAELGLGENLLPLYLHQLSGRQARRVSLVRALAMRAQIIVADEPTAGLDLSVQGDLLNLLRQLQRELALTYIVVSHNLTTRSIFAHPAHHYTAALMAANPVLDPRRRGRRVILVPAGATSPALRVR